MGDFQHDIIVYQVESKCNDLEDSTTYTVTGSDSSPTPTPVFYALAGSSISLYVCGSTKSTFKLERLEIVVMSDDDSSNSANEVPYKVNFLHNSEPKCKDINFDLSITNYYSLTFRPPSTPMTFQYELTYNTRVIDPNILAQHTVANYTLHVDRDSHNFTLSNEIKYSCFVAEIREQPNLLNGKVHIKLNYGNRLGGLIAGPVSFFILLVIFFIVILATKKLL